MSKLPKKRPRRPRRFRLFSPEEGMREIDLYWFENHYISEWPDDLPVPPYRDPYLMESLYVEDMNGREIWEDDIIRRPPYRMRSAGRGSPFYTIPESVIVVQFREFEAYAGSIAIGYNLPHEYAKRYAVIGNVHMNPELIPEGFTP